MLYIYNHIYNHDPQTMWKWFYYTPNTLKEMYARQQQLAEKRGETVDQASEFTANTMLLYIYI